MKNRKKEFENLGNMALLVIDIQNDFCHDKGIFAKLRGLNVKPAQEATPKIKKFIDEARKHNMPIIYTKQIESEVVSPKNLQRQITNGKLTGICAPNSWGSELYQLEPIDSENVIEKHTYDAFSNPKLQKILKRYKTKTLIITGVNTDVCIDSTIRSAFTKGYIILVPKDLIATMNTSGTKYYLNIFDRFFGTVTDSKNIIDYIKINS